MQSLGNGRGWCGGLRSIRGRDCYGCRSSRLGRRSVGQDCCCRSLNLRCRCRHDGGNRGEGWARCTRWLGGCLPRWSTRSQPEQACQDQQDLHNASPGDRPCDHRRCGLGMPCHCCHCVCQGCCLSPTEHGTYPCSVFTRAVTTLPTTRCGSAHLDETTWACWPGQRTPGACSSLVEQ